MSEHIASAPPPEPVPSCPDCQKPLPLCICSSIVPIDNTIALLVLQHPQEQDKALGTARITALHFQNALLKVGLSWPSLSKILGQDVDPSRWAILYLGSAKVADMDTDRAIVALNKKGEPEEGQNAILKSLEGVIVLDGTWSQAKALWWRNAWMLKCRRIALNPASPSRYGKLRREPRGDGLSTLEAVAMLMATLERKPEIADVLHATFDRMLMAYRDAQATMPELAPKPRKRDWRRRRKS